MTGKELLLLLLFVVGASVLCYILYELDMLFNRDNHEHP